MPFATPEKLVRQFAIGNDWHVADFGVGSGAYAIAAAREVGPDGHVYAIDIQQRLLSRVKNEAEQEGLENVSVLHGDIEERRGSGLEDASMDAVIVSNVLFQLDDREAAIREAGRVLRPQGKVLAVDWRDSFGGTGPSPDRIITPEKMKALFQNAGFQFERELTAGEHHYGFVFRKMGSER